MTTRRSFLTSGLALGAAAAAPAFVASATPRLHGDGIHDDTDAIQAMIDSGRPVILYGGIYRVTRPLRLISGTYMAGGKFPTSGDRVFRIEGHDITLRDIQCVGDAAA